MKTSLVIPCYWVNVSTMFFTNDCLHSLRYGQPDEVILVDDGSPQGYDEPFDLHFHPHYVRLAENSGYAAAVNKGLSESKGDVLIISNNDIIFTPGWLPAILKPIEEGYDISSIVTSDSGWRTRVEITEGDKFGSLWAMKREVYEAIGGLDETFGNYFEDLDYQRRAEQAGFKVGKYHGHVVEHLGRGTFKDVDPDQNYYWEAGERYFKKWKGKLDPKTLKADLSPDFGYLL